MNQEEFRKYIESIGFKLKPDYEYTYLYKEFKIYLNINFYNFNNGSELNAYSYNDLSPLLKLTRSIKLKSLLR